MTYKKIISVLISALMLLSIAACGKSEPDNSGIIIPVSSVDELIDAIGSDRCVELKPGTYTLSSASTYGKSTGNEYCYWRELWNNDYELVIDGVANLTIEGSNSSVLAVPRSAAVITFSNCSLSGIQNLVLGHTIAAQACEGGVLRLSYCKDMAVVSCSLYGCGTVGIMSECSDNIIVRDSDIYSCSSSAVDFAQGSNLSLFNCDIHNLGDDAAFNKAYSIFNLGSCSDIKIDACRVHDCASMNFLTGYGIKNIRLTGLNMYSNHFSSVFDIGGTVTLENVSFSSNVIDKWLSDSYSGRIILNGSEFTGQQMDEAFSSELSAYGVGTVDINPQSLDYSGCREVHVTTADEFLDAIASDTVIYLDCDKIELTEAMSYTNETKSGPAYENPSNSLFTDKNYAWLERYDGFALAIGCVKNFHIAGPGQICTQITYADVLSFYNCDNISLDSVTLGHDAEPGSCVGGVVNMSLCEDVIINACDLYGCGILGISAYNCDNVYVQYSLIHDCSYGGVVFCECQNVAFIGSDVNGCPFPNYDIQSCINFSLDGKLMAASCSF